MKRNERLAVTLTINSAYSRETVERTLRWFFGDAGPWLIEGEDDDIEVEVEAVEVAPCTSTSIQ